MFKFLEKMYILKSGGKTKKKFLEFLYEKGEILKKPISMNEKDWYSLSLDRLDSDIGYTKENTVIVTKFVNISKNDLSLDLYLKLLKEVCE